MEQKYFIVRTDRAGVFFGQIKEKTATSVIMTNVRKVHYWEDAAAVEQMSQDGLSQSKSRLTVIVPEMEIASPIQIIECTEKATANMKGCKEWKR